MVIISGWFFEEQDWGDGGNSRAMNQPF